jgi:hypothetical protein
MRFMILVKSSEACEAGVMPSEKLLADMGKYNEALAEAGVLRAAEGLHPSGKGARVRLSGDARTVVEGPFPEAEQLLAGFWLIDVPSREDAIEWVKRCPDPHEGERETEIEIRQLYEADDFGPELTPELRDAEERLRAQLARQ